MPARAFQETSTAAEPAERVAQAEPEAWVVSAVLPERVLSRSACDAGALEVQP
jgi:hypothetical protein